MHLDNHVHNYLFIYEHIFSFFVDIFFNFQVVPSELFDEIISFEVGICILFLFLFSILGWISKTSTNVGDSYSFFLDKSYKSIISQLQKNHSPKNAFEISRAGLQFLVILQVFNSRKLRANALIGFFKVR